MIDAWGVVPVAGRGSLPFALVHGESLVAAASFALEAAGVELLDPQLSLEHVRASGRPLVLHDPLCPLTPVEFIVATVEHAVEHATIAVAHRPVTDTVKEFDLPATTADVGVVGATLDRSELVEVTSPIVLPAGVVAALEEVPERPFPVVVDELRRRWPVALVEAPSLGRRVHAPDDVAVLEALSLAG